jgi:hypothetical protein
MATEAVAVSAVAVEVLIVVTGCELLRTVLEAPSAC